MAIDLKNEICDVPDFPKPGIVFKDLTPLIQDAAASTKRSTSSPPGP